MEALYEHIALTPAESFRLLHFRGPFFPAPWHFHPEHELTLIVQSSGTRFVGDNIASFSKGDLVLVGGDLPHCWLNREDEPGEAESIVVQFRRDFLGTDLARVPELSAIRRLLVHASHGLCFDGAERAKAERVMLELPGLHGGARLLALLEILLALAASAPTVLSRPGFRPSLEPHDAERLDQVHRFLLEHFTEPVRLAAVAAVAHMSPAAFCRWFKRRAGKTLVTALNDIRIGHACRLLIESDRTISEACYESGFNSLAHFHRQFLTRNHCTPSAYRKRFADSTRVRWSR